MALRQVDNMYILPRVETTPPLARKLACPPEPKAVGSRTATTRFCCDASRVCLTSDTKGVTPTSNPLTMRSGDLSRGEDAPADPARGDDALVDPAEGSDALADSAWGEDTEDPRETSVDRCIRIMATCDNWSRRSCSGRDRYLNAIRVTLLEGEETMEESDVLSEYVVDDQNLVCCKTGKSGNVRLVIPQSVVPDLHALLHAQHRHQGGSRNHIPAQRALLLATS